MEKECISLNLSVEDTSPGTAPPNVMIPSSEESWEVRLAMIRKEIIELHEGCENSYPEMGKRLLQAKAIYKGHGTWTEWLKENVPFSVRHAQRLIRVAEICGDTTLVSRENMTPSKAYILTRIDKKDIDHFCHTSFLMDRDTGQRKYPKDMTKRELEKTVKAYLFGKMEEKPKANVQVLDEEEVDDVVHSRFQALELALTKTITSIRTSKEDMRHSLIEKLEELCQSKINELTIDVE